MKAVGDMSIGELAAFVCTHLKESGISTVLTGGGCVSIYTANRYMSYDLDFVDDSSTSRFRLKKVLSTIGFFEERRYFKHPDTEFFIEFPSGPLSIGNEPVRDTADIELATGTPTLLSPTDCVKDRLAHFFHWNDQQCLEQALLVAESNPIDIDELQRWSDGEKKSRAFSNIRNSFEKISGNRR